jgi:hypothetical protein
MKIKAKKAIKVNSMEGDSFENGTVLTIIGEVVLPENEGEAKKMYLLYVESVPSPVFMVDFKAEISSKTEILELEKEYSDNLEKYVEILKYNVKFYEINILQE